MTMRRRQLIATLGAAALAWPLAARAQQDRRMRRIGVLIGFATDDPVFRRNFAAFAAGLKDAGWIEGQNIRFEIRSVPGGSVGFGPAARDLVQLAPDVILAVTAAAAQALLRETQTTPIVFELSVDPVAEGLVKSFPHPGGNATGFTQSELPMGGKWVQLLKQIAPGITRIAVVYTPDEPFAEIYFQAIEAAARSLSLVLTKAPVRDDAELESALSGLAQRPGTGLVLMGIFLSAHRAVFLELAARYHLPAIYPFRYFAAEGGLISYGVDQPDLFRQGGGYVDRILRGAKPDDLPVQGPKKFELVINLKTATAIGITVPDLLLTGADEVIE